ncbi:hypothetical protein [Streptomyces sp. NPDC006925]|uniref:hypothetical protein n=1 Tax=Streptomyces sp. NPDC006925 TaxID=3364768 RepID=UPI0036A6A7FE
MVDVRAYTRGDGTEVGAHTRSAPGSGRQLSLLALAAVVVLAIANGEGGGSPVSRGQQGRPEAPAAERHEVKTPVLRITLPDGKPVRPEDAR